MINLVLSGILWGTLCTWISLLTNKSNFWLEMCALPHVKEKNETIMVGIVPTSSPVRMRLAVTTRTRLLRMQTWRWRLSEEWWTAPWANSPRRSAAPDRRPPPRPPPPPPGSTLWLCSGTTSPSPAWVSPGQSRRVVRVSDWSVIVFWTLMHAWWWTTIPHFKRSLHLQPIKPCLESTGLWLFWIRWRWEMPSTGGCVCPLSTSICSCFAPAVSEVRRDRPSHAAGRDQEERAGAGGDRLQSRGAGTPSSAWISCSPEEKLIALIHRKKKILWMINQSGPYW